MNTFLFLFSGSESKLKTLRMSFRWVIRKKPTTSMILERKVHLLTLAGANEPYFEFLGYIRDNQFVQ